MLTKGRKESDIPYAATNHDHRTVRISCVGRLYAVNDLYGIKIHCPYD